MLMDEPFGAIDPINRERLQNEFLRLQQELRKTVVFVTHDIDEAIKMGDRIAILRKGGKLAQYATPAELLSAPADAFVEDFVGADRALKRLSLQRVRDIDLAPPTAGSAVQVRADQPLRDALSTMLASRRAAGRRARRAGAVDRHALGRRDHRVPQAGARRPRRAGATGGGPRLVIAQVVIHQRTETCVSRNDFCPDWIRDHIGDYVDPLVRHVELT